MVSNHISMQINYFVSQISPSMLFMDAFAQHKCSPLCFYSKRCARRVPTLEFRAQKITIFRWCGMARCVQLWIIQANVNKSKMKTKKHWLILNKHYAICCRSTMMMYLVHTLIFIDSLISNFRLVSALRIHETVFVFFFHSVCVSDGVYFGVEMDVTQFLMILPKSTSCQPSESINGNDKNIKKMSTQINLTAENILIFAQF